MSWIEQKLPKTFKSTIRLSQLILAQDNPFEAADLQRILNLHQKVLRLNSSMNVTSSCLLSLWNYNKTIISNLNPNVVSHTIKAAGPLGEQFMGVADHVLIPNVTLLQWVGDADKDAVSKWEADFERLLKDEVDLNKKRRKENLSHFSEMSFR
jgi:hypothetical protein